MRISERVTWPVTWPEKRGAVRRFFSAAANMSSTNSTDTAPVDMFTPGISVPRGVADVDLPGDLTAEVPLERLAAEGQDGVLRDVIFTQESVSVEGVPDLDLLRSVVTTASTTGEKNPHHASAHWEMTVEVDGGAVTLYGPWATFAWLGHLARWPVPAPA